VLRGFTSVCDANPRPASAVPDAAGVTRIREGLMRALAARQHSVISRAQMLDIGFGPRAIDRRVEAGELRRLHRGVYLLGPVAPSLAREMAAVLACAPDAYLSHASAGHLWAVTPYLPRPDLIHVTVTRGDPRRPGIRVHSAPALTRAETTTLKRIPITTPARTLLDLAPTLTRSELERSLAETIRTNRVRRSQLHSMLALYSRRPGAPALRALLERDEDPAFTRRQGEARLLALLREADLPRPEANASLGPYEIDFLWREQRLAVEFDSWQFHSDRRAFEADRRRDADLVSWGYRVIRVTWREVEESPVATVARIASTLAVAPI
jgi:very-short-patch-repair endonuclease